MLTLSGKKIKLKNFFWQQQEKLLFVSRKSAISFNH